MKLFQNSTRKKGNLKKQIKYNKLIKRYFYFSAFILFGTCLKKTRRKLWGEGRRRELELICNYSIR